MSQQLKDQEKKPSETEATPTQQVLPFAIASAVRGRVDPVPDDRVELLRHRGNQQAAQVLLSHDFPWAGTGCVIVGAEASGKTTLLKVSALQHQDAWLGAPILTPEQVLSQGKTLLEKLVSEDLPEGAHPPIIFADDADRGLEGAHTGKPYAEMLFHFYNALKARRGRLILAARQGLVHQEGDQRTPAFEAMSPDLTSRLAGAMTVTMAPMVPDEALEMMVVHMAAQLQLMIRPSILTYLLPRLPRDYVSLHRTIKALNHRSWQEQKPLSMTMARDILSSK